MKTRVVLSVAAAGLLAAACSDSSSDSPPPATTTGKITLRGLGGTATGTFNGPHPGRPLRAALVRWSDGATLDLYNGSVAASGDPAFVVTFAPSVDLSVPYKVHYWIDHNGGQPNDNCDAPPADHQWEVDAATGQTLVAVTHSTANFTNVCDTFSFPLTFRGTTTFNGPHANNYYQAALVKGGATTPLEVKSGTVAATGIDPAFLVTFAPRLFIGDPYSVKLWADLNGTGACDAPSADHQWSKDIDTAVATHQTTVSYDHNTTFTNVCSFFEPPPTGLITLRGLGGTATGTFNGPHASQAFRAALVRPNGATVEIQKSTVAASGDPAFEVAFATTVNLSVPYRVRYWVDHNGNGACDPPSADHQWETQAAAGQTLVNVTHSTNFTNVCGTLSFPLTFRGTTTFNGPHAGQAYRAALVAGGATTFLEEKRGFVAAAGVDPAFSVTFTPSLFIGDPYSVKLWIDFNTQSGAGVCDAPPTDHQWSVPIVTDLGTYQPTVPYAHNTSFTDVCSFLP